MYYANETDPVTINFCDFSDAAVAFQQHLSTWSGEIGTFATCVRTFLKDNLKYESCDPPGPYDKELGRQLNGMGIEPELFNAVWQHMPKKQEYTILDLYTERGQDFIIDLVANNNTTYLWLSNAFYMEYALVTIGKSKVYEYRQRLIDGLKATGKRFVLDLMDPWQQGPITFNDEFTKAFTYSIIVRVTMYNHMISILFGIIKNSMLKVVSKKKYTASVIKRHSASIFNYKFTSVGIPNTYVYSI
jgi:hypothetical protein